MIEDDDIPLKNHILGGTDVQLEQFYETSNNIETFEPKITRKTISVYEFARIITDLAIHLYELPNVEKYIDEIEVKNIIDPCSLAFKLLMAGKYDCLIDRGYERVSFSKLKLNKHIVDLTEAYLNQQEERRKQEIIDKLLEEKSG